MYKRQVNAQGFGDYDGGFAPGQMTGSAGPVITGCSIDDDLSTPLGNPNEGQLAAALNFAETGTCSPDAVASAKTDEPFSKITNLNQDDRLYQHPRMKSFDVDFGQIDLSVADDK